MKNTCIVDGCDRHVHGRGYCATHYTRWVRHGEAGAAVPPRSGPVCTVGTCDRPHLARGMCSTHYKRWQITGDPGDARINTGCNTYSAVHERLRRHRGRASEHPCEFCGDQAGFWAYDHLDPDPQHHRTLGCPYSLDILHYVPLCGSCHQSFDRAVAA